MIAYLSLGSNIGNRKNYIKQAIDKLKSRLTIIKSSSLYETQAVGLENQPPFLNLVLKIETVLSPTELLGFCQQTEGALGRERVVRWGPRTIDIDILLYDDQVFKSKEVTIPHSRITERRFVIEPLLEVEPEVKLPDGRPLKDFIKKVKGQKVTKL